jgi:hypothetical protein
MKKIYLIFTLIGLSQWAYSGNPDRAGGAGASQLLINPWAMSSGIGGVNTATVKGIESFHLNVAGLAYTESTELAFASTSYLQGTGVRINSLGLSQAFGSSGNVIGLSISSWDFGNLPITNESQPNNTLGTFTPQLMNIGLGYARKFSNSITGGIAFKILSEGIQNARAYGIAVDAGVQYQTALNPKDKIKKEDFRFGISVRNIGPDMSFSGTGLSFKTIVDQSQASPTQRTTYMGSQAFNLPALVHIGAAYDIRLDKGENYNHKLTLAGNFNYNAFSQNVIGGGMEYAYKKAFMLRGAYNWQERITSSTDYRTQYIGWSAGATFLLPISKSGTSLGIDYAYTPTRVFNGIHTIGVRFLMGSKKS